MAHADGRCRRHFKLPANGTPSLLFVFEGDIQLGARAYSEGAQDFAPGSEQRVRLDFWADEEWTDVVQAGALFKVWYGGDVGHGKIENVLG